MRLAFERDRINRVGEQHTIRNRKPCEAGLGLNRILHLSDLLRRHCAHFLERGRAERLHQLFGRRCAHFQRVVMAQAAESAAALQNRAANLAFCERGGNQNLHAHAARRLPGNCDIVRITAKRGDVFTHPVQCHQFILQTVVS